MWGVLMTLMALKNFSFFFYFLFFIFSIYMMMLLDFSWPKIFSYFFLADKLKMFLMFLTMFVFFFILFFTSNEYVLKFSFSILTICLILCFLSSEMMMFYIFFELSLMPTLYIMFSWGLQPERVNASLYFLMYALMGSFPFLAKIIYISLSLGEFKFFILGNYNCDYLYFFCSKNLLIFFWVFSFLMKLPIYGVHLWLPKAHVEAPVYGSMVLAAILLKLGGYGLIRLSIFPLMKVKIFFLWMIFSVILLGFISFRKIDLKSLIAYSSICHMAFSIIFFYLLLNIKVFGALVMFVGHGFISSCLFFSFNLIYLISKSRKIFLKEGMKNISKIFYFFFFFMLCLNSSLPMNLTFFSEIIVGVNLFLINKIFLLVFLLSVFLVGLFKMKLFLFSNHGNSLKSLNNSILYSLNLLNLSIMFFHIMINFVSVYFLFSWFF